MANKNTRGFWTRAAIGTAAAVVTLPAHAVVKTVEACGKDAKAGSDFSAAVAETTVNGVIGAGKYVAKSSEKQVEEAKALIAKNSLDLAAYLGTNNKK